MDKAQLYLKPEEQKFLGMAVASALEHLHEGLTDQSIPWTPESRKTLREIKEAGEMLKAKLIRLGFDVRPLPSVEPGEEDDYLTKPS